VAGSIAGGDRDPAARFRRILPEAIRETSSRSSIRRTIWTTWRSIIVRTRSTASGWAPPRRISSRPARIGASGLRSSCASTARKGEHLRRRRPLVDPALAARLPLEVLDGIGEVGDALVEPCLAHRLAQELTGRADERLAAAILLLAGGLADKHQRRIPRADAEHDRSPRRVELAPRALAELGPDLRQRLAPRRGGRRDEIVGGDHAGRRPGIADRIVRDRHDRRGEDRRRARLARRWLRGGELDRHRVVRQRIRGDRIIDGGARSDRLDPRAGPPRGGPRAQHRVALQLAAELARQREQLACEIIVRRAIHDIGMPLPWRDAQPLSPDLAIPPGGSPSA